MTYELRWLFRGDLWIEEYITWNTAKLKQDELKNKKIESKIFNV